MELSNFDFIPHKKINDASMEFDYKNNFNKRVIYSEAGFNTYNFILNSGTVFWTLVCYGIIALIYSISQAISLCLFKSHVILLEQEVLFWGNHKIAS